MSLHRIFFKLIMYKHNNMCLQNLTSSIFWAKTFLNNFIVALSYWRYWWYQSLSFNSWSIMGWHRLEYLFVRITWKELNKQNIYLLDLVLLVCLLDDLPQCVLILYWKSNPSVVFYAVTMFGNLVCKFHKSTTLKFHNIIARANCPKTTFDHALAMDGLNFAFATTATRNKVAGKYSEWGWILFCL